MVATATETQAILARAKNTLDRVAFGDTAAKNLGSFLNAVRIDALGARTNDIAIGQTKSYVDALHARFPHLTWTKANGLSIGIDPEGGILVPPGIADDVWRNAVSDGQGILGRLRQRTVPSIRYEQPAWAERGNSRAEGSRNGGLRFYDVEEGEAVTGTVPRLRHVQGRLSKIVARVDATNELFEDAADLIGDLSRLVAEELNTALHDRLINQAKAGKSLSLLKSPSKVTVAKESGQAAATVLADNLRKMRARLYCKLWGDGCWLVNPELVSQLSVLDQPGTDTTAARIVQFIDPLSRPGMPFALIDGLPAFALEECPAPGTEGDIILCAPSTVQLITRSLIPDFKASMHVKFDRDEQAFMWTVRYDTFSLWNAPLTPLYGTDAVSNIVTLATRS